MTDRTGSMIGTGRSVGCPVAAHVHHRAMRRGGGFFYSMRGG